MAFQYVTFGEVLDIVVMSLAIGYIFKDLFRFPSRRAKNYDPLTDFPPKINTLKYGIMAAAPAVVLHELAHKFVAISMGVNAVFKASYLGLAVGVGLKLIGSGFIFLIPGYVIHSGNISSFQSAMIAVAGPATNLAMFLGLAVLFRSKKIMKKIKAEYIPVLRIAKYVNGFLFVINMLPFGPLDGASFFGWLLPAVGSIF